MLADYVEFNTINLHQVLILVLLEYARRPLYDYQQGHKRLLS